MKARSLWIGAVLFGLAACGGGEKGDGGTGSGTAGATKSAGKTGKGTEATASTSAATTSAPASASASGSAAASGGAVDCSAPRKTIESQVAIMKAGGPLADFQACFTARQREKVTQEDLDKAKAHVDEYKMDELYASDEPTDVDGKKAVKVKMKNGRSLTTLVQDGDKWLADTRWYR